ncbi:MAG: sulfurtransferase TusA family protein [Terracoccus sp.]
MSRSPQPADDGDAGSVGAGETDRDAVLDARGLRCPLPVIRLARLVGDHPALREVTVLTTDPAAAYDIPAWCRLRGHDYLGARDRDGHTEHRVAVRPIGQAGAP